MKRKLELPGKQKPYLMAHRGNRVYCPENTIAAFERSFEDGIDILETDLHLSKDDQFICIHDDSIDRTTNGSGQISSMSALELKNYAANNGMSGFEKERIPFLEETIAILPSDVALALELKSDRFLEIEICKDFVNLLKKTNIFNRTILLSFNEDRLRMVQKVDKDIPIGLITMKRIFPSDGFQMIGPFFPLLWINPIFVKMAKKKNMLVCPLDPVPEKRLKKYIRMGCDAIISDNPYKTRKALNKILGN